MLRLQLRLLEFALDSLIEYNSILLRQKKKLIITYLELIKQATHRDIQSKIFYFQSFSTQIYKANLVSLLTG